ncbi:phosphatase PAP2 family protein [Lewinella sp. IMCC34183]|uniref:phosphatase PAP2 family protein n=1 Tax=Lewinella sp. IMCC34183 TaxID=2248762 RepID=UPI000E21EBDE|nr:phosphatase PAP2 family protein [Lewinella sp. IMCC34183]
MTVDYAVFDLINRQAANPFLDAVVPVYRDKLTWIPLYAGLLWLIYRRMGLRDTVYLLLCIGVVIAVADQVAASVLKPWVGKLRPCADPLLEGRVRSLVPCGGKFTFPSNHATNHFALATVLAMTLVRRWYWQVVLFLWAASIALAQVYVGKHFPVDVLAGASLGTALGIVGVWILRHVTSREPVT